MIEIEAKGKKYKFIETKAAPLLIKEIFNDNYKVFQSKIEFSPGDVILDVGANEGMFSILMAKEFPETRIIALEPVPSTYATLVENLKLNEVKNVSAYNIGLGKEKTTTLVVAKDFSGGSTKWCTFNPNDHIKVEVGLISLDDAFLLYGIDRCKLLKMDIEGMEYEVLYPSTVLNRVDYFTGEFHTNHKLDYESRRADGLVNWIVKQTKILQIEICKMAE